MVGANGHLSVELQSDLLELKDMRLTPEFMRRVELQSDLLELKEQALAAMERTDRALQSDLLELKGSYLTKGHFARRGFNRTCWN